LAPLRVEPGLEGMLGSQPSRWITRFLVGAWMLVLLAGMAILWRYEEAPCPRVEVPGSWPGASNLLAAADEPTLVVFTHPCCPCSRATLAELSGLLPRYEGRLRTCVSSYRPSEPPPGWDESSVRSALENMPGAELIVDRDGREAALFGVATAGHVLLYGRKGELRYSGGITAACDHMRDNIGPTELERALGAEFAGDPPSPVRGVPVFGCSILDHASTRNP